MEKIYYIDVYIDTNIEDYYNATGKGLGTFEEFTPVTEIPEGYKSIEFELVKGFKTSESLNADTATKLANPVSLWGQQFDGSKNVSGAMTGVGSITFNSITNAFNIGNNGDIQVYQRTDGGGWAREYRALNSDNITLGVACGMYGNEDVYNYSYYGGTAYNNAAMYILPNKNVGIGTFSPTEKLEVRGNIKATGKIYANTNQELIPEAPKDGKAYVRKNGAWIDITTITP